MKTAPKPLFRIHRRGRAAFVGREPLPAVEAFVAANRSRFRPGTVAEVIVEHESYCRYPKGGSCSCPGGPEIRVRGEDPGSN